MEALQSSTFPSKNSFSDILNNLGPTIFNPSRSLSLNIYICILNSSLRQNAARSWKSSFWMTISCIFYAVTMSKSGKFATPETCENWLDLVNSWINYAHQTRAIKGVLSYSIDFEAPRERWNPLRKTVLSKWSFNRTKGLWTAGMSIKHESNLYSGPVIFFP